MIAIMAAMMAQIPPIVEPMIVPVEDDGLPSVFEPWKLVDPGPAVRVGVDNAVVGVNGPPSEPAPV